MYSKGSRLTFRELEAFASLRTTRFLTLNLTGVASHEAFLAESGLVFGINLYKRTGDSETESLCLTFVTATVKMSHDVIFLSHIKSVEGLLNDILKNRRGEVDVERTLVDNDVTATLGEINSATAALRRPIAFTFSIFFLISFY